MSEAEQIGWLYAFWGCLVLSTYLLCELHMWFTERMKRKQEREIIEYMNRYHPGWGKGIQFIDYDIQPEND